MPSSSLLFHFVRLAVVIDAGILRNSIAGGKNATGLPLTAGRRTGARHRYLNEGPRWRINNRHNACWPGASEPATHKVGIESMSKRHAGHRSARVLAGHDHLTLEFWRMVAPDALRWRALHGVHLSAWWTLSSRFSTRPSRCLHRTLTRERQNRPVASPGCGQIQSGHCPPSKQNPGLMSSASSA